MNSSRALMAFGEESQPIESNTKINGFAGLTQNH